MSPPLTDIEAWDKLQAALDALGKDRCQSAMSDAMVQTARNTLLAAQMAVLIKADNHPEPPGPPPEMVNMTIRLTKEAHADLERYAKSKALVFGVMEACAMAIGYFLATNGYPPRRM